MCSRSPIFLAWRLTCYSKALPSILRRPRDPPASKPSSFLGNRAGGSSSNLNTRRNQLVIHKEGLTRTRACESGPDIPFSLPGHGRLGQRLTSHYPMSVTPQDMDTHSTQFKSHIWGYGAQACNRKNRRWGLICGALLSLSLLFGHCGIFWCPLY